MPIYQLHLWICEICLERKVTSAEVLPYDDTTVVIEPAWGYIAGGDGVERLACPICLDGRPALHHSPS